MQQAYVQVVSVALGLCKLHTILIRMVKAAQLMLGGFLCVKITYRVRYTKGNSEPYLFCLLCYIGD